MAGLLRKLVFAATWCLSNLVAAAWGCSVDCHIRQSNEAMPWCRWFIGMKSYFGCSCYVASTNAGTRQNTVGYICYLLLEEPRSW